MGLTANCYLIANLGAFLLLLPLGKHVSIHTQISLPLCIAAAVVLGQVCPTPCMSIYCCSVYFCKAI